MELECANAARCSSCGRTLFTQCFGLAERMRPSLHATAWATLHEQLGSGKLTQLHLSVTSGQLIPVFHLVGLDVVQLLASYKTGRLAREFKDVIRACAFATLVKLASLESASNKWHISSALHCSQFTVIRSNSTGAGAFLIELVHSQMRRLERPLVPNWRPFI